MLIQLPKYGQHCLFLGATGSGKTMLATQMFKKYESYIIIDTQHYYTKNLLNENTIFITNTSEFFKKINIENRIVYQPSYKLQSSAEWKEVVNLIFNEILNSSSKNNPKPKIIYVDEIYQLGFAQSIPKTIEVFLAVARQRHLSLWIATQRPKNIPTNALPNCTYIYTFFLSKKDDKEYIASFTNNPKEFLNIENSLIRDEYKFILIDNNTSQYKKFNKLKQ